jgi:transposase-like protein
MARLPDEYSARVTARELGVHINTVYRWCKDAKDGLSDKFEPGEVRLDASGHWFQKAAKVTELKKKHG